jgi:uncharacterized protein YgbK (DUF1537 family)
VSPAAVSERAWEVAVLDDDPTGTQTLAGVTVLLEWAPARVQSALERRTSVHLLTNSRALEPAEARAIVTSAASAVLDAAPGAATVLRGDSTLRGHLLEEYLGVCDARSPRGRPTLLLAPALPSAGRVTIGGVQYLERAGSRIPVGETEFAEDGRFSYRSSRVLEWAEERSNGFFNASTGIEISIDTLRDRGAEAVAQALRLASRQRGPMLVVADSETMDDVERVAAGFRKAVQAGADVILRCGPAVAGALNGAAAPELVAAPSADSVLLVCGSYVSASSRQLQAVADAYPESIVEVTAMALATGDHLELSRAVQKVRECLRASGLAVLATARDRPVTFANLDAGMRIARALATIVRQADCPEAVVVAKGGITAAVTVERGLGALEANVVGPVVPGVSLWTTTDDRGRPRTVLIVPGNVGDDRLLIRLVELIRGTA